MKKFLILVAAAALLVSCGSASKLTRGEVYAPLYNEAPVTLLVMPPINNTANVEAKDLLYTSISRPLVEAGYYVLSPILTMDILKAESAYDAELFFEAPIGQFGAVFGADAVIDPERGTVMVMNPDFDRYTITALTGMPDLEKVFGPASYHGCDYSFFYLNIRNMHL